MKRILSVFLAALTLLAAFAAPAGVFAKSGKLAAPYGLFVCVPDNKAQTLRLSWEYYENKCDGYQIFRSESGKKGSYKKIASTKKKAYTDTGLKKQTVYYYAVRAYAAGGGKTLYSAFVKDDCATKITKKLAYQLLQKAYAVYEKWIYCTSDTYDENKTVKKKKKMTNPDGSSYTAEFYYYQMTDKSITSTAALKAYLSNYFESWQIDFFVDDYYLDQNGRLYVFEPGWGGASSQDVSLAKVRDIVQRADYATFSVIEYWSDFDGSFYELNTYMIHRESGNWVFCDESWFPEK